MHIEDFRELRSDCFQTMLEFGIADQFFRALDGGGLALDVREDVGNLRDVAAHFGFEFGDLIVRIFQRHAFVEFDMLLDVEASGEILNADVVNVEISVRRDGPDAVKNIFAMLSARQGLHGDVRVGQDAADGLRDGCRQLTGSLESHSARESYGEIGEVAVSGAPDANAIDFENSIDAGDGIVDLRTHTRRSSIEQRVNRTPGKAPAYGDDDARDKEGGDRVGIAQPVDVEAATNENQ